MFHYQVTRASKNKNANAILLPEFTDTNLRSTTAETMLDLSSVLEREIGYHVAQVPITLDGFIEGILSGMITETGGLGTAAVVAPVGKYILDLDKKVFRIELTGKTESPHRFTKINELIVRDGQVGDVSKAMYKLLTDIQTGKRESPNPEWLVKVPRMR
jgi:branched-chain amino acid aminotransferase